MSRGLKSVLNSILLIPQIIMRAFLMASSIENEAYCSYYFCKYLRVDKNNLSLFSGVGSPACSCLAGTGIGVFNGCDGVGRSRYRP